MLGSRTTHVRNQNKVFWAILTLLCRITLLVTGTSGQNRRFTGTEQRRKITPFHRPIYPPAE
jgi:hypothetical protein